MPSCRHGIDERFCAVCRGTTRDDRRAGVKLRAGQHDPKNEAEREAYEAVYAYEEAMSTKAKRFRASRTWQMIARHGVIQAVERIVTRRSETAGYRVLVEIGLHDMAFEAVVLRHPDAFSEDAVTASRERLDQLQSGPRVP